MNLDNVDLISSLKSRMGWLNARQQLVAQNVANSDTPGYVPRDLKPQSFDAALRKTGAASAGGLAPVRMTGTSAGHLAPPAVETSYSRGAERRPDSETTLDGNAVVLEEQMLKMAESRSAYDAAISLYQKSLGMIRLAVKAPGR